MQWEKTFVPSIMSLPKKAAALIRVVRRFFCCKKFSLILFIGRKRLVAARKE
jgi:hypothetical protein